MTTPRENFEVDNNLFVGPEPARANTVFDAIRVAVLDMDQGEGIGYAALEEHLLENYTPRAAKKYDGSYIKSYVRDAVKKFGYLSHEKGNVYSVLVAAKASSSGSATSSQKAKNDLLKFVADKGEVNQADEINESRITIETVTQETKKKTKTVTSMVDQLIEEGLLRREEKEDSVYIFLTEDGFEAVCTYEDTLKEKASKPKPKTEETPVVEDEGEETPVDEDEGEVPSESDPVEEVEEAEQPK